jgi:hypothetical protein
VTLTLFGVAVTRYRPAAAGSLPTEAGNAHR